MSLIKGECRICSNFTLCDDATGNLYNTHDELIEGQKALVVKISNNRICIVCPDCIQVIKQIIKKG